MIPPLTYGTLREFSAEGSVNVDASQCELGPLREEAVTKLVVVSGKRLIARGKYEDDGQMTSPRRRWSEPGK